MPQPTNVPCPACILFVDDSKLIRLAAQRILEPHFELLLAGNAEDALRQLEARSDVQVVFTDINLPGMSGYQLIGRLRKDPNDRRAGLPIVAMTGVENQESERQKALELGASDFLGKPFRHSELLARTWTHVRSQLLRRQVQALESNPHRDPRTGLASRDDCIERVAQALSFARRHAQAVSLVTLHLDGLCALADELGEPFAGQAWWRLGRLLKESIRREDTVYRIGPESFCFLLPATEAHGAAILRDRFIPNLEALGLDAEGGVLDVRCRFLIASPDPRLDHDLEALIDGEPEPRRAAARTDPRLSLDEVLESLERGERDQLKPHVEELRQRLEPLLALLSGEPSDPVRTGSD
ncbi:GGDEF domain-containing response regulator [Wenzhouxiangella marina]|uniref:Uncharacterized protein n=1 Tax=Wenzhouxiangella marina TaxID=1579979 RepID=A0A0K0XZ05_9GAMM|nr:response regulator [Wenzhouxiangella marina]AKS42862.1 hypothetical protein WM2015_2504 [Wenzhouxiangella marina]MBB6087456.1 diguanylate cyclase (GGDEF)-like protein [Wenzhouxiangella marina]